MSKDTADDFVEQVEEAQHPAQEPQDLDQGSEEGPAEPDPHAGLCVYDTRLLRFVSPVFRGDDAEEEALAFVEDHAGDLEVREV